MVVPRLHKRWFWILRTLISKYWFYFCFSPANYGWLGNSLLVKSGLFLFLKCFNIVEWFFWGAEQYEFFRSLSLHWANHQKILKTQEDAALEASLEGSNKQVGNVKDVINQNSEMTAVGHFSILWYFFQLLHNRWKTEYIVRFVCQVQESFTFCAY